MSKMWTILFLLSLFSHSAFAQKAECTLKDLKVVYDFKIKDSKSKGYIVSNIEKSFWVTDENVELKKNLEMSLKDKNFTFGIHATSSDCENIKSSGSKNVFYLKALGVSASDTKLASSAPCFDCMTLARAPVTFEFPTMKNIKVLLTETLEQDSRKAQDFQRRLYQRLRSMDFKTPQANSIAIIVFMIEDLSNLGLKEIRSEQLQSLARMEGFDLTMEERTFIERIIDQIDSLEFSKNAQGHLLARLKAREENILILASDVPARDESTRESIDKHLDFIRIDESTTFSYGETTLTNKRQVKIEGVAIKGDIPIIGRLQIRPLFLDIDLDAKAPVKAQIQFQKGIKLKKNFAIDY